MNIREEREAWERAYLSPYASRSSETRGRDREEQKCDIRRSRRWARPFIAVVYPVTLLL